MAQQLPQHLQKYIVDQDYQKYTPQDHAVWRYCLRQLKKFLSVNAHACYLEGLEKTGISTEYIPKISTISEHLQKFGWRALPVSGFIPPAAFMELQSLGVLPIASDMRSADHLLYTPAPDIVHEAAGHAPIIVDEEYADYLKQYSQVAKKAIISKEDLDLYEAIRTLSDMKENPASTAEDIKKAEKALNEANKNISHISEATQLSRMNWWTAEYGLIGDIKAPKIFGAGLLSSVGESRWCLSDKVKKIPLTVDCVNQGYDITEPQPQLYVTPDFQTLVKVLKEFSETMAYKMGGTKGLAKAIQAQSVNTVQLDSGIQISGILEKYLTDDNNNVIFLKFSGPSQLSLQDQQLTGHGTTNHAHGYSVPLGSFKASSTVITEQVTFEYASGFKIQGVLANKVLLNTAKTEQTEAHTTLYTFKNATVTYQGDTYFLPEWGDYDVVCGSQVTSVFGGPADRVSYGSTDDFEAIRVPAPPKYSEESLRLFNLYQKIRNLRESSTALNEASLKILFSEALPFANTQWLLFVELLELAYKHNLEQAKKELTDYLTTLKQKNEKWTSVIDDGIATAHA